MTKPRQASKAKLLDAALNVVRARGYNATRVDDICTAAGVTKGSFFHHFSSKDALALEAIAHWDESTSALFADAPYHRPADPLDRLLAYVDFRISLLGADLAACTCFAGTIVQEAYATHPELTAACNRNVSGHARSLETDIEAAMERYDVTAPWTAESLALHIQAVIQGSFVLAKAADDIARAVASLEHLRRYIALLFGREQAAVSDRTAPA